MPRPKKLHTLIAELITERARESALAAIRKFLVGAFSEKLLDQGVCPHDAPVDSIVDWLMNGQQGEVPWDESPDVTITFNEEDYDKLEALVEEVTSLAKDPEFFMECMDSAARSSVLKALEEYWRETKVHEAVELYGFRKKLELTWGAPLDSFRMMISLSREILFQSAESLSRSKAKSGLHLRDALCGVHARTLRTATAVLVLLEHGLADDAYARWRTLYELGVIASFLSAHGDSAAERYLAHEVVAHQQRVANEGEWEDSVPKGGRIPKGQRREIEREYKKLIKAYGKSFRNPYGWAADFIGNENPRFVDIEESIKGKKIAPPYKESSQQVHGGRAGLLGLGSDEDIAAIGHSDMGLDIPLMHSSLCLMQVTSLHLYHSPACDLVLMAVLTALDQKIDRQCRKVARELDKELENTEMD